MLSKIKIVGKSFSLISILFPLHAPYLSYSPMTLPHHIHNVALPSVLLFSDVQDTQLSALSFYCPEIVCSSPFTFHYSLIAFGIFWFYLTLSVESGIIPIKDVIFEHRVYLPSAGIALAAVTGLVLLSRWLSSKLLFSLMAILLVGLAAATIKRNMVWQSPIAVWEDIVAKSPNKLRPYYNLGCEYAKNDDMASAIKYFQQSIKIKETQPECHNNLGSAYIRTERMDEALYHIQRALELNPSYSMAYFNLGLVYAYKGQSKDAVNSIEKAIELDPKNHEFKSKLELLKQYL